MNYVITDKGLHASPTAPQNIKSWTKVKKLLIAEGAVSKERLISACVDHDHARGPEAYIDYIENKNGWIRQVAQK